MKKLLLFLASTLMAASMSLVSLAGSWQQDTYGWRYLNDNGTYSSSSWLSDSFFSFKVSFTLSITRSSMDSTS